MKKSTRSLLFGLCAMATAVLAVGCAHHRDVRPGADGLHRVTVQAAEEGDGARDAISQANHYCEQTKTEAAVVSEKTSYTGSMDENTRKTLRQVSRAAGVMGTALGGGLTDGGRVVGTAGNVGHTMTNGLDYTTEMQFKCR